MAKAVFFLLFSIQLECLGDIVTTLSSSNSVNQNRRTNFFFCSLGNSENMQI